MGHIAPQVMIVYSKNIGHKLHDLYQGTIVT
jgi:hypothetical protein